MLAQPVYPCRVGETLYRCREIDEVYALAVRFPRELTVEREELLLSPAQREGIDALKTYQQAALAGIAP